MQKISFKELCGLVASIDYLDYNSYPVSFLVKNADSIKGFECGIGHIDEDEENLAHKAFSCGELQYLRNFWNMFDLQDPDDMVYREICEMLKNKCGINENTEIILDTDCSFNGEIKYWNEELKEFEEECEAL